MKRRKIKLFASVASFALVAAVMSFGVFAAVQTTVGVSSNVAFSATGVQGTLVASTTGAAENKTSETLSFNPVALSQTQADGAVDFTIEGLNATIDLGALNFVAGQDITYSFAVTDIANATKAIDVALAAYAGEDTEGTPLSQGTVFGTNENIEVKAIVATASTTADDAEDTATVSITLGLVSAAVTVAATDVFFQITLTPGA